MSGVKKRKRLAVQKAAQVAQAAAPKSRGSAKASVPSARKRKSLLSRRILIALYAFVFVAGVFTSIGFAPVDVVASITPDSIGRAIDSGIEKLQGWIGEGESDAADKGGGVAGSDAEAFVKKASTTLHFFPVGNADSTLIISKGKAFLVDAGNSGDAKTIKAYLAEKGIKQLEAVVATHPHADHIGGMAEVIREFKPKRIYMPDLASTTKTFEKLLDAIEETGMELIVPEPGDSFKIGEVTYTVFGPINTSDKNTNNHSIVLRGVCGSVSFLLCADAEKAEEADLIKAMGQSSARNLSSTILKVGHHGRKTSSTEDFIKAVSPKVAIIHCGEKDGKDGPDAGVLSRLSKAAVYRTDQNGMIILGTDGKTVKVTTEK